MIGVVIGALGLLWRQNADPGRRIDTLAADLGRRIDALAADVRDVDRRVSRLGRRARRQEGLSGGGLALGRYEVTVGEYRAFASATGGGASGERLSIGGGDSWRDRRDPPAVRRRIVIRWRA